MSICPFAHTVTQAPHCYQCSAIKNSQADPWFPATRLAQPPLLVSPLPHPHDRQQVLLPTSMPAFGFPPPRGPQIPD